MSKKQRTAQDGELGELCAVFGFVVVFVAVMTPILYLITRNKELEAELRNRSV